ncbi:hypothetical protein B0H63DRAFT_516316 [Podospora didyma]|uniref:Mid2 domain-containing protein n=1 Tax=Podospora didyma TaxID=330526 RepID=A0AAE0P4I3_9PEZI|nr:hypothetical protein B0H63DRAFT_516316 [Podospora didyma]
MHLKTICDLLVVGLSAISVAEATFVNGGIVVDRNGRQIQRRQESDESKTANAATSSAPTSAPTVPPSPSTSSTPAPPKSTSTPPSPSSSTPPPPPPSSTPTSAARPSSSSPLPPDVTSSPPAASTTPPPETKDSTTKPSQIVDTITETFTSTLEDGSTITSTKTSTKTSNPTLSDGTTNQSQGMTPQTRNTVIGVVVGVGGAIILAGLAFVAYRVWGRKKSQLEDDGLGDYTSTADKSEATGSMSGRTPFQSTLESYHAPTQVNTASNF